MTNYNYLFAGKTQTFEKNNWLIAKPRIFGCKVNAQIQRLIQDPVKHYDGTFFAKTANCRNNYFIKNENRCWQLLERFLSAYLLGRHQHVKTNKRVYVYKKLKSMADSQLFGFYEPLQSLHSDKRQRKFRPIVNETFVTLVFKAATPP